MPERWETEIRKLRRVEPRRDLRDRVDEGPRGGDEMTPARQRVIAAVTALAVFIAAGVFAVRVFGDAERIRGDRGRPVADTPIESIVIELSGGEDGPRATLAFDRQVQQGVFEGYTWCSADGGCTSMTADLVYYPPVSEYVVVPPGTEVTFTGDGTAERVRLTDPFDEVIQTTDITAVQQQPGRYVFSIDAVWPENEGEGRVFLGVEVLGDEADALDTLVVDCSAFVARTNVSVVRTTSDGLRIRFTGVDGFDFTHAEIVTPEGTPPDEFGGMGVGFGDGTVTTAVAPGRWEIGCARDFGFVRPGEGTAAFRIVDPDDHYAPVGMRCDAPETSFTTALEGAPDDIASQLVTGLADGDRFREAGYGAEWFKRGLTYVVDRDGEAIATLILTGEPPNEGTFASCADSGIELADAAAATGSAAEAPDVLVVRCEGMGPAVDATTVRLQPDGLHVEATNFADAELVAVEQPGRTSGTPFDEVTERFLVPGLVPGKAWIGCRVANEDGQIAGEYDDVPEAYVEVTLLSAEG